MSNRMRAALALLSFAILAGPTFAQTPPRLDPLAAQRATQFFGSSRVIVSATTIDALPAVTLAIRLVGGMPGRALPIVNGVVADVPNAAT